MASSPVRPAVGNATPLDEQHGGIVVHLVVGMLENPVSQLPDRLGTPQAFGVRPSQEVGQPLDTETGTAAAAALDQPVGVEEHPIRALQLHRLDNRRRVCS